MHMRTLISRSRRDGLRLIAVVGLAIALPAPSVAQDTDQGVDWPQEIDTDAGTLVVYQPQVESFQEDKLTGRSAVSLAPPGTDGPVFGALWFDARMSTDFDERTVTLLDLEVTNTKFPEADEEQVAIAMAALETVASGAGVTFSLDQLLAGLALTDQEKAAAEDLNHTPPEIYFRTTPTLLVSIDGDPVLMDVDDSRLQYVANTAFFIVYDASKKRYYLTGQDTWYRTNDVLGEWEITTDVPREISELARKMEEQTAQADGAQGDDSVPESGPPQDGEEQEDEEPVIPAILVSTEPAELIQSDGAPQYASVEGTQLLYMTNTESDVVMDIGSQLYYVLIAGRWFTSGSLTDGEWSFMPSEDLPSDFPLIPADSDMGDVRPAVAGTDEAREAVLENQIPQTATIDRTEAKVSVSYDGDPTFEMCDGIEVAYATNTDRQVLLVDGTYYCCDEAVWFVSSRPDGPWVVADAVPDDIQTIPPSCPCYNVKYVYIYDSTPDVVYIGYTPGYVGSYVYGGVVVYGTGFWYRPWIGRWYYPRPVTWGFGVHWNPYTGWGFSVGIRVGGWVGWGWHPWYRRAWWGPAGYRAGYRHGYHRGYHHGYHRGAQAGFRAGYRAGQRQGHANVYRDRSTGVRDTGQTPGRGQSNQMRKSKQANNVYADRNGDVHRQSGNEWQSRQGNSWQSGGGGAPQQSDLNRDQRSRERGNQRSQNYDRSRSGGDRSGGTRSGGGRRR